MMMFAPNSLVRQKEGAHGEKEEAGGRRKGGPTGIPTPAREILHNTCPKFFFIKFYTSAFH